ncbi:AI-2E family transporter [Halomonas sp. AOP43-A1-21]|uniref:AI-2E family transporter n=1 Tax=Halomonas TaxID=2745 RepID=UPI0018687034|nr:AI-2E family transporter [Halomonas colorata]
MRSSWLGGVLLVVFVGLVYVLNSVLMPFIASMVLAYLADPLSNYFQRLGMKRTLAVCLVFLILLIVLTASLLILIPLIVQQIKQLGDAVPGIFSWVENVLAPQVQEWTGYDLRGELTNVREVLVENWRDAGGYLAQALGHIGRSGMAFMTWITYIALIPVVTFYLLLDWNRMLSNIASLVPRQWASDTFRLARRCDEVLSSFLRGQLLVMLCLGVIYATGLTLMGLNFGLLIGFVAGLVSFVPFLGFIVGIAVALIVALFQYGTWWAILGVIVVFSIGQAAESVILQPKLLGDKIGLHPVAVIFAVLAGGNLFGFTGVLLALPVAAVFMVLLRELNDRYKHSSLYTAEQRSLTPLNHHDGLDRHDERESS